MRSVARALLDLGHRRMLFVVRNPSLVTTRRSINAFRATLRPVRAREATGEERMRLWAQITAAGTARPTSANRVHVGRRAAATSASTSSASTSR